MIWDLNKVIIIIIITIVVVVVVIIIIVHGNERHTKSRGKLAGRQFTRDHIHFRFSFFLFLVFSNANNIESILQSNRVNRTPQYYIMNWLFDLLGFKKIMQ